MKKIWLTAAGVAFAGAVTLATVPAQAFWWGPWGGGPWHGGPWHGGYPSGGWGYPYGGGWGYPWGGYGYPLYGAYPYGLAPMVTAPVTATPSAER